MIVLKKNAVNEIWLSIGGDNGMYSLNFNDISIDLNSESTYSDRYKKFVIPEELNIEEGEGVLTISKQDVEIYRSIYLMESPINELDEQDFEYEG